jgi:hypothetical protein
MAEALLWLRCYRLFGEVPFRLGLIGFELDGNITSDQLNGVAPEQRWEGSANR